MTVFGMRVMVIERFDSQMEKEGREANGGSIEN
jgi:hypothetical protein